jgi:tetrapyrrole methylase family protein/MazG family protein
VLLVVPLAADEVERLTIGEWDALKACRKVLFEDAGHPLIARLVDQGIDAGPFDDEPDASWDERALVAAPDSPRILELARAGADVTAAGAKVPDALTAAHAATVVRRAGAELARLTAIMARLRSDDGCPWDREQTHESLRVHLVEEAYEVLEAIDRGTIGEELEEELGDLLLQVAFHARLATQEGRFDLADVADRISTKLLHRHPHVFGEATVADAHEVVRNWETIKSTEKKRTGPFEGIPHALPALLAAAKTQKRAAQLGFLASEDDARKRAAKAVQDPEGLGEAFFWLVALARARGIDPEGALREAIARFKQSL